jgi:RHS repeat-associated protein
MLLFVLPSQQVGAQSLTGPSPVCHGQSGTYYFDDDQPGLTVYWYQDGNYLGTGSFKNVTWYAPGTLSVDVYSSSLGFLYNAAMPVEIKTPGTISGPANVCPSQGFTLSRSGSIGNSFTWWSKPSGGSTWTNIGTGTSVSQNIHQRTDYQVILNDCGSGNVTSFTVDLFPTQTAGTIQVDISRICQGTSVGNIYTTVMPEGQNASYQWQSSADGFNFSNISGATSFGYNPGAISNTTFFRRNVTGCGDTRTSNSVTITVDPRSSTGTLSASGVLCGSNPTAQLTLTNLVSSETKWIVRQRDQGASNWTSWSEFSTANQATNSRPVSPASSSAYRNYEFQVSAKNGVCGLVWSNMGPTVVYPPQTGGVFQAANPTVCYGSPAGAIQQVTASVGANASYQWFRSFDNATWNPINGATGVVYDPGTMYSSTYYKRFTQDGCGGGVESVPVYIAVSPNTSGGVLSFSGTVPTCGGGTVNLQAASVVGTINKWNYRYRDGAGAWTSWAVFSTSSGSANSFAMSAPAAAAERVYQFSISVKSGACPEVTGAEISTTVYSAGAGGQAVLSGASEAFGTLTGSISVNGAVGTVTAYQESLDGSSWTNRGSADYAITQPYYFRVQVQNGTCPPLFSQAVAAYAYSLPAIYVQGTTSMLPGTVTTLSIGRYYSYQWTKDGADIPGATASSFQATEPGVYRVSVVGKQGSSIGSYTSAGVTLVAIHPSASSLNAAIVTHYFKPGLTEASPGTHRYKPNEVRQGITYMDGMGRTIQQVAVAQTPERKDVIQPYAYNAQGLSPRQYLPYATALSAGAYDAFALRGPSSSTYTTGNQYLFYQSGTAIARDTVPYAGVAFEASPLNRVVEQGAPGQNWRLGSGHTVRQKVLVASTTQTDAALKDIKIFTPNGPTGTNYANFELAVTETTDENNNKVWTISDKMGRTILKRVQLDETLEGQWLPFLETYYVYDSRGNLALQIPPKAAARLNSGQGWTTAFRDEWCFVYTYDQHNRLIEKKVPGSAPIYYAYDRFDRLILTQDGNLRATNRWLYIKYDIKDRPVITGMYQNNTHTTRDAIQTQVLDPLYPSAQPDTYTGPPYYEERGTVQHGYTNQSFPTTGTEVYAVNYYDHYDFDGNGTDDYSYTAQNLPSEGTQGSSFGLPTGSKRLILNSSNWLYTYQFYDRYGRVAQVRTNNHLSLAIDNLATVAYNFDGTANNTKTYHKGGGGNAVTTYNTYLYDHAGRLLRIKQRVNSDAEVTVASYRYNELGQVIEKNLHCTTCPDPDPAAGLAGTLSGYANIVLPPYNNELAVVATNSITMGPGVNINGALGTFVARIGHNQAQADAMASANSLQSVDYRYNIRGWLTHVNNATLTNDGTNNNDVGDYFGMELNYDTPASGLGNTAQFNGNISAITWKSVSEAAGSNGRRSYAYAYDKTNRLKTATFRAYGLTTWDKEVNTLNEHMTYDANGNILTLLRNHNQRSNSGLAVTSTAQLIDNLTYTYASGQGNKLTKVEDAGTTQGFNNQANQTTEYTYDANGSLTEDKNKGVSAISYNLLGKPQQITFTDGRTITYSYDAGGTKLKMTVVQGAATAVTDYVGNFVYSNGALSFFGSPEGRVVKNGSAYEYQYALADHQGNTRVLFTSATPAPQPVGATFEAAANGSFQNYTNRVNFDLMDHTDAGTTYTYAQRLTGGGGSQVGVARSYKIYPGDKVKIEAFAKYFNPQGTTSNLAGFATSLLNAFGVAAPGVGEAGTASAGLNHYGGVVAAGGGGGSGTYPKVFVNILLFDKNFRFLDIAYEQINGGEQPVGDPTKQPHDYMSREYTAREEGYAYVFVSNENPTLVEAYFDDVTFTYTPGNLVQYNEYYPFGLNTSNSWTRENVTGNNFQYNQGTELNPSSGYYDLFFRNFDPALGRFVQVDPLASLYHNQTPYQYGNNDPVYWSDPSGAATDDESKKRAAEAFARADAAFDALNSGGMYGAAWNMMTYGSSMGTGGSAFVRYGPGDGGALRSFVNQMLAGAHAAAGRNGSERLLAQAYYNAVSDGLTMYKVSNGKITQRLAITMRAEMMASSSSQIPATIKEQWAAFFNAILQTQNGPGVIDNTSDAWDHYMNGNGAAVNIGPNSIQALVNSQGFQSRHQRIISGKTNAMNGNFAVDMTSTVFHIGNTRVDYSIQCSGGDCYVKYTLFKGDGFWDVDFLDETWGKVVPLDRWQPDKLGPNLERLGGTPYPYNPTTSGFYFSNPGYK